MPGRPAPLFPRVLASGTASSVKTFYSPAFFLADLVKRSEPALLDRPQAGPRYRRLAMNTNSRPGRSGAPRTSSTESPAASNDNSISSR